MGSVLGANSRFIIYNKLKKLNLSKDFITCIINTLASFCLGLFLSFINQIDYFEIYEQLVLFFSIGFLGSLSTFSTFVYDLFDLVSNLKFFSALKLLIFSLALGLIALAFGLFVGNQ